MNAVASTPDAYLHVRVIIGIVLGLSLSKLLSGIANLVQHPSRERIFSVHLIWVAFAFLMVVHFWWYEFYLSSIPRWTFALYVFVILYASLHYLLCALLFPDKMDEYVSYADYFMQRRAWFFGLLALIFAVDLIDTAIKGRDHFDSFGWLYPTRNFVFAAVALAAIFIKDHRIHLAMAIAALGFQAFWILRAFYTL